MKKVFIAVVGLAFVAAMGLSSCKKCITCTATNLTTPMLSVSQEYCGSKSQLDVLEASFESTYSIMAGYSSSCVKK